MAICGIDPGLSGALAYLTLDGGKYSLMDMPTTDGIHRPMIDTAVIKDIVENVWTTIDYIIIERPVWMKGKNNANATATTWYNYGRLTAAFDNWGEVLPRAWKKEMGLSRDKQESLDMAAELFPNIAPMLARKKDHGRAEALLLAEWFRRSLAL